MNYIDYINKIKEKNRFLFKERLEEHFRDNPQLRDLFDIYKDLVELNKVLNGEIFLRNLECLPHRYIHNRGYIEFISNHKSNFNFMIKLNENNFQLEINSGHPQSQFYNILKRNYPLGSEAYKIEAILEIIKFFENITNNFSFEQEAYQYLSRELN